MLGLLFLSSFQLLVLSHKASAASGKIVVVCQQVEAAKPSPGLEYTFARKAAAFDANRCGCLMGHGAACFVLMQLRMLHSHLDAKSSRLRQSGVAATRPHSDVHDVDSTCNDAGCPCLIGMQTAALLITVARIRCCQPGYSDTKNGRG